MNNIYIPGSLEFKNISEQLMKIKSKLTVLGLVPQDSIGFADVFVFGAVMHIVFLRYFLFF
jgi:hypothetical protein